MKFWAGIWNFVKKIWAGIWNFIWKFQNFEKKILWPGNYFIYWNFFSVLDTFAAREFKIFKKNLKIWPGIWNFVWKFQKNLKIGIFCVREIILFTGKRWFAGQEFEISFQNFETLNFSCTGKLFYLPDNFFQENVSMSRPRARGE